jgi:dienelactone hydrolase
MRGISLGMIVVLFAVTGFLPARAEEKLAADLNEEVVRVPVTLADAAHRPVSRKMVVTQYRPDGSGPFPLVVISHGRSGGYAERAKPARFRYIEAARYFVHKGFAVLVPTRVGYGESGRDIDPESSGFCSFADYSSLLAAAPAQVMAALDYGRQLPWVDGKRILLLGQSVGGLTTTATAALNPPGVVAAINFAGGSGGSPQAHPGVPCRAEKLEQAYAEMGKRTHVPMLWIYTQNDKYFGPDYSQSWAKAYQQGGAALDYRLLPAFGDNGHFLFARGAEIWMPLLDEYLKRFGFNKPGLVAQSGG